MQQLLKDLLKDSFQRVKQSHEFTLDVLPNIQIERCRDPQHGDFSSNVAMILAKTLRMPPRQLAELLVTALPSSHQIEKVSIAGPGFINFTMAPTAYHDTLHTILQDKNMYGQSRDFANQRLHLEFVSANPTGPLHVGHGRSAAYATCVGNLLEAVGYQVHREYYVNDAGRQMRILALSTWLRYLQQFGEVVDFPSNAYQGDYIIEIANKLRQEHNTLYWHAATELSQGLTSCHYDVENKETMIDAYIKVAQQLIGEKAFNDIQTVTLETILEDIRDDLTEFGVRFNDWFHESQLVDLGLINQGIALLKDHGHIYERDGAVWFRATEFGDEKDRVLIRENGQPTYFASDVAYHLHKYQQNYDKIIDVFGADHHGYIARIRAFLQGLGENPEKLNILLVQFVSLFRGEEKISMSTRSGSFITLRELRQEVGNDAARFFYIFRKPEQHLDFDLELAKRQSNDNPVYYIQYAYARICSVWRQLESSEWTWSPDESKKDLLQLNTSHEKQIMRQVSQYAEIIQLAARQYAPHILAHYLHELAHLFHSYYNNERFLIDNVSLRNARLYLITAVEQILFNGLSLLGIAAPMQM